MTSDEQLRQAFARGLGIEASRVSDSLAYNSIREWDSVAHMAVIAELERAFDIMLDTDDVIDLSSVAKAKEILGKYQVSF
jgi:acyl carrier protein